jgi:hypothetical protein
VKPRAKPLGPRKPFREVYQQFRAILVNHGRKQTTMTNTFTTSSALVTRCREPLAVRLTTGPCHRVVTIGVDRRSRPRRSSLTRASTGHLSGLPVDRRASPWSAYEARAHAGLLLWHRDRDDSTVPIRIDRRVLPWEHREHTLRTKRDERIPRSQRRLDLVDEQHDSIELTLAGGDGGLDIGPKFLVVPGKRADIHNWVRGGRHGRHSTGPLTDIPNARMNNRSTIAALMPEWSGGGDAMTSTTAPDSC